MDTGKQAGYCPDFLLFVTHSVPHRNFQQCHYVQKTSRIVPGGGIHLSSDLYDIYYNTEAFGLQTQWVLMSVSRLLVCSGCGLLGMSYQHCTCVLLMEDLACQQPVSFLCVEEQKTHICPQPKTNEAAYYLFLFPECQIFIFFSSSYERENIAGGKLIIINIIVFYYDLLLINSVFQWMSEKSKVVNCQIYMLDLAHDHDCCCD